MRTCNVCVCENLRLKVNIDVDGKCKMTPNRIFFDGSVRRTIGITTDIRNWEPKTEKSEKREKRALENPKLEGRCMVSSECYYEQT